MSDTVYFLLSTGGPAEPLDTTGGTLAERLGSAKRRLKIIELDGGLVAVGRRNGHVRDINGKMGRRYVILGSFGYRL